MVDEIFKIVTFHLKTPYSISATKEALAAKLWNPAIFYVHTSWRFKIRQIIWAFFGAVSCLSGPANFEPWTVVIWSSNSCGTVHRISKLRNCREKAQKAQPGGARTKTQRNLWQEHFCGRKICFFGLIDPHGQGHDGNHTLGQLRGRSK
jgi:hypothetical protein